MSYSVSSLKNYILNDCVIDIIENTYNKKEYIKKNYPIEELNFTNFIFKKGYEYENKIYDWIYEKASKLNISLFEVSRNNFYKETIAAIKKYDIVLQPFIKDYISGLFGYPDILIKSSAFKKIFNIDVVGDYWIVIDIKWSSLKGISTYNIPENILNETTNYHKFIACQVYIYGKIVNKYYNKKIYKYSYIIPKQNITDNVNLLCVNLEDDIKDSLIKDAIEWLCIYKNYTIDDVYKNYLLYPNMNNEMDYPWRNVKYKIAKEVKELSLISGIGEVERKRLIDMAVFNFDEIKDKHNCSNRVMNIIKNINRGSLVNKPSIKICDDICIFIDIETSYIFELETELIVMVTIGWLEELEGEYLLQYYTDFILDFNDNSLLDRLQKKINSIKGESDKKVLIHYTSAENKIFNLLEKKYRTIDLYNYVLKYNYLFKTHSYNLKDIVEYLVREKNIQNPYNDCLVKSGVEVMTFYNNYYEDFINDRVNEGNMIEIIKEIQKYNIADVRALYEIYKYIEE